MKAPLQALRTRFVLNSWMAGALIIFGVVAAQRVWRIGADGVVLSIFLAALLVVIVTRILAVAWSAASRELLQEIWERLRVPSHPLSKDLDRSFEELTAYIGAANGRTRRAEEQRMQLMDELFHALGQPLTSLRCQLEVALRNNRTAEQYRNYLAGALEQAERTAQLTVQLRQVSETLDSTATAEVARFDKILNDVVEEVSAWGEARRVRLEVNAAPALTIAADTQQLYQLLFHVLKFSVDSALPGTDVVARMDTITAGLTLTVASQLRGAASEVTSSAPNETSDEDDLNTSATFGLRFAEYIAEALGGSLERELLPGKQIVRVRLPVPRESSVLKAPPAPPHRTRDADERKSLPVK